MSRPTQFNRMPRILEPLPRAEIRIPAPPAVSPAPRTIWIQVLLPLVGLFVMVALYGWLRGDWTLALPMAAMSGVSVAASVVGTLARRRDHRRQQEASRRAYADMLDRHREELERLRAEQVRIRTSIDPDLVRLLTRSQMRHRRLWERRPGDADFLHLRLGLGSVPSIVKVHPPPSGMPGPALEAAQMLVEEYECVPQVPVRADLEAGPLGVAGSPAERTALAQALVCNLVAHHSPDEVHLLIVCPSEPVAEYQWLGWLPHTHLIDFGHERRLLGADEESRRVLLDGLLDELYRRQGQVLALPHSGQAPGWPWLVLVVTDFALVKDDPAVSLLLSSAARRLNATGVFLVDRASQVPSGCVGLVSIEPGGSASYSSAGCDGLSFSFRPDQATGELCDQLARSLAPLRVSLSQSGDDLPDSVRLLDLLGVSDVDGLNSPTNWTLRSPSRFLKVPVGLRRGGRPMELDLSQAGHGPHGLVAGTTGSGKSELLQTLVIALALTHHPHDVGFVLVDFKGGGAFSCLKDLPHTQGLVTDLSAGLAERALVALRAEMDRRKRLLSEAELSDIDPYQALYWQRDIDTPLPHLFVVIDEFAELVSDYPEFMEGLIEIARTGRSLGLHLILATQSPAGVVKQQIWANARFRICLRVESRQESMDVLHRPEASELPGVPGRAYLQVGSNDVFELFQVARVAGQYLAIEPLPNGSRQEAQIVIAEISALGQRRVVLDTGVQDQRSQVEARTDLEVIVARLIRMAREMGIDKLPNPWPEPLPACIGLPGLLDLGGFGGWDGTGWAFDGETEIDSLPPNLDDRPWLGAVVGLVDDPANQRRELLVLNLAARDGHLVAVGSPGSGKEMWARTLVTALVRTHTPAEVHLYLLEFSGQALQPLSALPHVAGLFGPLDNERVHRLFQRLLQSLSERKRVCGQAGVDTLVRLREVQRGHTLPAVVVVINGFLGFQAMFSDGLRHIARLVREGGPYGIHLVLIGDRGADIPSSVSNVVERRIALRLSDAEEFHTVLGARVRDAVEGSPYGRGWYGRPPLEFQTAKPVESAPAVSQAAALAELATAMDRAWKGSRPAAVESLPTCITLDRISAGSSSPTRRPALAVPLGLDDDCLQPVWVHMADDGPDFLIGGTRRSGKTTLVTTWALQLVEANSPQRLQFLLMSGRGQSLHPLADLPHVLEHCAGAERFFREGGGLDWLRGEVRRRESLRETDPHLARDLSRLVVILDDYEQISYWVEGQAEARSKLQELAHFGDVNMHFLVTGPLPDLGGGLFRDPLLRRIRAGRSGFVICPLDPGEQNPLGIRVAGSGVEGMVPGRGYIVRRGVAQLMQVAWPGDDVEVGALVGGLRRRWCRPTAGAGD